MNNEGHNVSRNGSEKQLYNYPLFKNGQNSKQLTEDVTFSGNFLSTLLKKENYDDAFLMVAEDNSMMPEVKKGAIILVDTKQTAPDIDGTYVVKYDDHVRMKVVQQLPGNKLMLNTLDKKFEPIIIEKNQDEFEILGRVVLSINPI